MGDRSPGAWERVLMLTIREPRTRAHAQRLLPTVTDDDLNDLARLWHDSQTAATWDLAAQLVQTWKDQGSPRRRPETEEP